MARGTHLEGRDRLWVEEHAWLWIQVCGQSLYDETHFNVIKWEGGTKNHKFDAGKVGNILGKDDVKAHVA